MHRLLCLFGIVALLFAGSVAAQEKSWQLTSADKWHKVAAQTLYSLRNCETLQRSRVAGCKALGQQQVDLANQLAASLETWDRARNKQDWEAAADARMQNATLSVAYAESLRRGWTTELYFPLKWEPQKHGTLVSSEIFRVQEKSAETFRDSYCKLGLAVPQEECSRDWNELLDASDRVIAAMEDQNNAYRKADKGAYYDALVAVSQAILEFSSFDIRNKRKYFGLSANNT